MHVIKIVHTDIDKETEYVKTIEPDKNWGYSSVEYTHYGDEALMFSSAPIANATVGALIAMGHTKLVDAEVVKI